MTICKRFILLKLKDILNIEGFFFRDLSSASFDVVHNRQSPGSQEILHRMSRHSSSIFLFV